MKMTFKDLEKKLLSMGGTRVEGDYEEELEQMLTRGERFSPKKVKSVKMKPCRCHANSGVFWILLSFHNCPAYVSDFTQCGHVIDVSQYISGVAV
jgi:hypothetical protein